MSIETDPKDLLWFFLVAMLVLALGSTPIWMGRAAQTTDLIFRGTYMDPGDYSVHISMMQAGRMGDWSYQLRFTSEPHQPAYLRMFYIVLGHISKWINLPVETTFHLARWIFGIAALFAVYRLCLRIFPQQNHARAAFALAAFGAGLGWLQLIMGVSLKPISPIDFWLIDAYVFFSLSLFPSFAFTLTLMAAALSLFLDFLASPHWGKILWVSVFAVVSQFVNPIAFAVVDAAFAGALLFLFWRERRITWKHLAALGLIALAQIPSLIYNFIVLSRDPVWSQFTLQNRTLSPPPSFYLWGFGLFWPFAIFGMVRAFQVRTPAWGAILAWTFSAFALAYVPVFIQRRFLLGITIPLAALAIFGLAELLNNIAKRAPNLLKRENLIYFTYILFASLSSIFLALSSSLSMRMHPKEIFYPGDLASALTWLDENSAPNEFVLSSAQTGQLLGQRTRFKAYLGHEMETLHFDNKQAFTRTFYEGSAAEDWLAQTPIRFVIYGPYEQKPGASFEPGTSLQLVYENDSVKIYEVK